MTARPEIVEVLTDMDLDEQGRFVFAHRDGRPFSDEERQLAMSAQAEEVRDAAALEAGNAARHELADLMRRYGLPDATLGEIVPLMPEADQANTRELIAQIDEAARIRGRLDAPQAS